MFIPSHNARLFITGAINNQAKLIIFLIEKPCLTSKVFGMEMMTQLKDLP